MLRTTDKQTDRQTDKQTDSKILPTPTDIVGMGGYNIVTDTYHLQQVIAGSFHNISDVNLTIFKIRKIRSIRLIALSHNNFSRPTSHVAN